MAVLWNLTTSVIADHKRQRPTVSRAGWNKLNSQKTSYLEQQKINQNEVIWVSLGWEIVILKNTVFWEVMPWVLKFSEAYVNSIFTLIPLSIDAAGSSETSESMYVTKKHHIHFYRSEYLNSHKYISSRWESGKFRFQTWLWDPVVMNGWTRLKKYPLGL